MAEQGSIVSYSDLLRAWGQLQPGNKATLEAIAQLLGLSRQLGGISEEDPLLQRTPTATLSVRLTAKKQDWFAKHDMWQDLPVVNQANAPDEGTQQNESRRIVPSRLERRPWSSTPPQVNVERIRRTSGEAAIGLPPFEPLLHPQRAKGILVAAVSTQAPSNELDIEKITDALGGAKPITQLPHRTRPTLARGAQLLVDVGESMMPFARDQGWMVKQIRKLLGPSRLEILCFDRTPMTRVRRLGGGLWARYTPPPSGTPVILLTDLGLGGAFPARRDGRFDEWRNFQRLLRKAGCRGVAFLPYRGARWPAELAGQFAFVYWDRPMTASLVTHALDVRHNSSMHQRRPRWT